MHPRRHAVALSSHRVLEDNAECKCRDVHADRGTTGECRWRVCCLQARPTQDLLPTSAAVESFHVDEWYQEAEVIKDGCYLPQHVPLRNRHVLAGWFELELAGIVGCRPQSTECLH